MLLRITRRRSSKEMKIRLLNIANKKKHHESTVPQLPKMLAIAWVGDESDVHQQSQDVEKIIEEHSQSRQPLKEKQQHSGAKIEDKL